MTKGNFIRYYNKLICADKVIIFFEYKKNIYSYICDHVRPKYIRETRESSSKGGQQKFAMRILEEDKEYLIAHGAQFEMTKAEFITLPYKNKGHKCEYFLSEKFNLGEYKPDCVRFDKAPDVIIEGIRYQVKFQNASLTNVEVLAKAQKDFRENNKKVLINR